MSTLRHIPYAVLTAGSLLVGGGAYAQSMYSIDQRQAEQQDWIRHGVRDGQLTPGETARLEQGEHAINRAQARAEADGHVSPWERQRIDGMVNRESHQIYRQSHDNQQAWDRGGRDGWGRAGWQDRNGWRAHDGGWGYRDADRRDWGHDHDGNGNQHGWDHRQADNRDWGRDHNWNGNQNGWNQNGQHGWNGGTPGQQHSWSGNSGQGGWQHGSTSSQGNQGGGWQHGGTATPGTGMASTGSHSWSGGSWGGAQQAGQQGPRMMPAAAPAAQNWTQSRTTTTTQSWNQPRTASNYGSRTYSGGRSFGHR
jgi:hypothetical protein